MSFGKEYLVSVIALFLVTTLILYINRPRLGTSSTVVGYNLANTRANTPVDKQEVILANAVLINGKYHDVHNSEAANEDKQEPGKIEAVTTAQGITSNNTPSVKGSQNDVQDEPLNRVSRRGSNFQRAGGETVDFLTQVSVNNGHNKGEPSGIHGNEENTEDTTVDASNDERNENTQKDGMYLNLHATAESIDEKLLRLLRDDVWTYTNDTPRPSGTCFFIRRLLCSFSIIPLICLTSRSLPGRS